MTVHENDDELVKRVARAIQANDPVPEDVIAGAKAAFIARDLDSELAKLLYDSAKDREPVLTRGDTMRTLSFATEDLGVELELDKQHGRIMGQLVPPQAAQVDLELDGLVVDSTMTDDLGRFRFETPGAGVVSVVCRSTAGGWGVCILRFDS